MDVRRKFVRGAVWSVLGRAANGVVSFIVFAIISRSVEAHLIGIIAFALVFIEFGRVFVYAGVPDLIVRQKIWDDDFASTCFWLNMGAGIFTALTVTFVIAPLTETHFAAGSGIVLSVLSLCFIIESFRMVSEAQLRRDLDYKKLAQRGVSATLLAGLVGIVMALTGWGIWALVAQRVASSTLTTLFTWMVSRWVPRFRWSTKDFPGILGHGSGLMGAAMLRVAAERLPDLILGLFVGPVMVAIYRVGARGFEAVSQLILLPIGSAALSAFARLANTGSLDRSFVRVLGIFATLAYPIIFGTGAISEEFVSLAFSDRWASSADIMMILAIGGGPAVLSVLLYSGLSAVRRTKTILQVQAISAITIAAILLITVRHGPVAVALGLTVHAYAGFVFYAVVAATVFGVARLSILAAVAPPFIACVAMFAAILVVRSTLLAGQPDWVRLPALTGVGALTYLSVMFLVFGRYLRVMLHGVSDVVPALSWLERLLHRSDVNVSRQ